MIEQLAKIPVEVDYGSEFRYRDPIVEPNTLVSRHQPIRRNRRHASRPTRSQPKRRKDPGDLQRGRLNAHPRSQRHHLHARRPGNRRSVNQGVHRPAHSPGCSPALYLGQVRGKLPAAASAQLMQELTRIPHKMETHPAARCRNRRASPPIFPAHRFSLSRPRHSLSDRARRRPETKGNFLHSRGGLSGRRNEARPQRADRRKSSGRGNRHARRQRSRAS